MLDWGTTIRPNKATVRNFLLRDLGHRPRSVWLPSTGAECVKEALRHGVINHADPVLFIEREVDVIPFVEAHKSNLGLYGATIHHADIMDTPIPEACNYAFIDLMGSLSMGLVEWLRRLVEQRANDLVIDITVSLNWRNNHFMHDFERNIRERKPDLFARLSLDTALVKSGLVTPMAVLSCALHEYDIMFEKPIIYKDSRATMLVFRILDIRDGPNAEFLWPSLNEVMGMKDIETTVVSKQSAAGHKAWTTRRAKIAADKRSDAAHKAWATRRARQAVEPTPEVSTRSVAAKKAWATRRENGWVHPANR